MKFNNFIEVSLCDILIDKDKFFSEILTHSKSDLTINDLTNIINDLKTKSDDSKQICNGHDISTLLAYLFNHKDNSDKSNINQERIEEALRLSYTLNNFKQTKLYNNLNNWQQQYNIQIFKT